MSFGNKTGGGFGGGGGGFGNKTGGSGFGGGGGTSGGGSGGFGNKTGGSGFGNNNNQSGNNNNNQGGGDQNGGNNNNNDGQGSGNNQGSGSGSGGGGFGSGGGGGGFGNKSGFGSGGGSGSGGGFGGGSGGGFGNKTGSSTQQQPMLVSAVTKGVLGPGFVPPNTAHWAQDIDLTQLRDDAVFEDLPASLQTHLKTIDAFMTLEQQAADEIRKVYAQLLDPQYPKGYHALREKIDRLTEGPTSLNAVRFQVNSLEAAVKTTIANTQAVQKHVVEYSKHVWDPVHNKGHDFWSHRQNASEGPSQFFDDTVTRLMQNIDQLETMLEELELALVPRSSTGGGSGAQGGAVQLAGGLGVGGGMLASGAAGVVANNNAGMRGTLATLSGVAMDGAQPALSTTQLVALTMQNELQLFLDLASRAAEHHSVADQVREEYRRQFGDHEAREFFDRLRRERAEADDLRQEGVKKMGFDPSREVAKATGGAGGASSSTSGSSGAGGGAAAGGGGGDDKPKTGFGGGGFGGAGGFGAKKDGDAAAKPAGAGFGFASTPAPKAGGNDTTANTPAQPEFPTPSALNQTDNRSGFGSPSPQPSKPAGGGFGKSAAPGGAGAGKFGFGAPKASDNNADNGEQPTKRGRD